MRIIFLADSISTQDSGIHYYGLQLIQELTAALKDFSFAIIASTKIESLSHLEHHIIPIKDFPFHLRWRQFTSIPKLVNRLHPDIVIELAHFGPYNLDDKIKRITVIHDLTPILFPEYHSWLSKVMHKLLLPNILKKSDHIIVNSEQTKNDIAKVFPKIKIESSVIYPKIFNAKPSNHAETHTPNKFILSIGTIEPRKNYDTLIKAFEIVAAVDNELALVIIGKNGWKNESFYTALENSKFKNRIHLLGYVSRQKLLTYIGNALAFCFPSNYEGFGIPIIEAMAAELPLILSDIPTSRAIAKDAALYFEKNDATSLGNLFKNISTDNKLQKDLKQKSHQRYLEFEIERAEQILLLSNKIKSLI